MRLCLIFQYEPIVPPLRVWLVDRSILREHESELSQIYVLEKKAYGTARDVTCELYLVFRYS